MAKQSRAGGSKSGGSRKKRGPKVGTGGHGRQALEGRGPTPKAEDRPYHPKAKAKARRLANTGKPQARGDQREHVNGRTASRRTSPASAHQRHGEAVAGRNPVVEALRAKVPADALYIATRLDPDDRTREALSIATKRGIPILEVTKPDLDRLVDDGTVHQGLVLKVPEYEYAHPDDLLARAVSRDTPPLIVALDGITDPRNLGAILRSVSAFGGHGVVVPERRSVGMTAAAWRTSAGAAARVPVALATNLTNALKAYKKAGLFVVGLDGGGDVPLPELALATEPLVLVIGSEGKGISRLVREHCDGIVSIPIDSSMESLNASVAAGIALYEVARQRS